MSKIREKVLYVISLIWSFLKSFWQFITDINFKIGIIENNEIERYSSIKSGQNGKKEEKQQKENKNTVKKETQQKSNKNTNVNDVINIGKYNPYHVSKTKNNLIKNPFFHSQLSDWYAKKIDMGKIKIFKSAGYFGSTESKLMLSIPECTNNSVAGIKQFINLKFEQVYEILITAKTDSTTAFPLLYLTVADSIYKIYCEPSYRYYKIAFKNKNKSAVKISINTGYKLSKTPTTFYINNILLYEK